MDDKDSLYPRALRLRITMVRSIMFTKLIRAAEAVTGNEIEHTFLRSFGENIAFCL